MVGARHRNLGRNLKTTVQVSVTYVERDELFRVARLRNITVSEIMRKAIRKVLDENESGTGQGVELQVASGE